MRHWATNIVRQRQALSAEPIPRSLRGALHMVRNSPCSMPRSESNKRQAMARNSRDPSESPQWLHRSRTYLPLSNFPNDPIKSLCVRVLFGVFFDRIAFDRTFSHAKGSCVRVFFRLFSDTALHSMAVSLSPLLSDPNGAHAFACFLEYFPTVSYLDQKISTIVPNDLVVVEILRRSKRPRRIETLCRFANLTPSRTLASLSREQILGPNINIASQTRD